MVGEIAERPLKGEGSSLSIYTPHREVHHRGASLAQLVEHRSRKAGVTSSSLVAGSMKLQVVALWRLPFLCEWLELFDCLGVARTALPRGCCRNSAKLGTKS